MRVDLGSVYVDHKWNPHTLDATTHPEWYPVEMDVTLDDSEPGISVYGSVVS